jgi:dGTPase
VVDEERRRTKEFLYANLYYSRDLNLDKLRAEEVVLELFEYWMAHPENLPSAYQQKAGPEPLARVICDYIAGMTDGFIEAQFQRYCRKD